MNDKQGFSYLLKVSVTVNVLSLMRILQIVTLKKWAQDRSTKRNRLSIFNIKKLLHAWFVSPHVLFFFQLSYLNVLPYCIHNHWSGLCVNTHETRQPGFQFVLRWLITNGNKPKISSMFMGQTQTGLGLALK